VLTQHAATFILRHAEVLEVQAAILRSEREQLLQQLSLLKGVVKVYPSKANFVLIRVADGSADRLFEALKEGGVLIKNLSPAGGVLADCLRVTVSTPQENHQLMDALRTRL